MNQGIDLDERGLQAGLNEDRLRAKVGGVTTAVANAIAKMTKRQKLALADRLLAEAGVHAKPSTVYGSDDPALGAELRRRLDGRSLGAWLSLDEFRARTTPYCITAQKQLRQVGHKSTRSAKK